MLSDEALARQASALEDLLARNMEQPDDWRSAALALLDDIAIRLPGGPRCFAGDDRLPDHPPTGCTSIFVADDDADPLDGGLLRGLVSRLREYGYSVGISSDISEVVCVIREDPSHVLLCDLCWQRNPEAGIDLLRLAHRLGNWRMIIALTSAPAHSVDLPFVDGVCAGPDAKGRRGAQLLHSLIWQRFRGTGH
jgi:hypothetical protein